MIELRLQLTYEALEAMVTGAELQFDVDDSVRVTMRCDDETVNLFRERFEKALLHMLPTGEQVH